MGALTIAIVCLCSLATSVAAEGVQWYMLDRKEDYRDLTAKVTRQQKRLEALKAKQEPIERRLRTEREIDFASNALQADVQTLSRARLWPTLLSSALYFAVWHFLGSAFEGAPVAFLPFTPVSFIASLAHRGVPDAAPRDSGFAFIFVLASIALRPLVAKVVGSDSAAASAPSLWSTTWEREERKGQRERNE